MFEVHLRVELRTRVGGRLFSLTLTIPARVKGGGIASGRRVTAKSHCTFEYEVLISSSAPGTPTKQFLVNGPRAVPGIITLFFFTSASIVFLQSAWFATAFCSTYDKVTYADYVQHVSNLIYTMHNLCSPYIFSIFFFSAPTFL